MAHSDRMFFLLNFELGERRVQKKFFHMPLRAHGALK